MTSQQHSSDWPSSYGPSQHVAPGDERLARTSHWYEVLWGIPFTLHIPYFAAAGFHPMQRDHEPDLRTRQPALVAWLESQVPGRWRFVARSAAYFNDTRTAFKERLFLFDTRRDAVGFIEAHGPVVVQSRLDHWKAATGEAHDAQSLMLLAPLAQQRLMEQARHEAAERERAISTYFQRIGLDHPVSQPQPEKALPFDPPMLVALSDLFAGPRAAAERLLTLPVADLVVELLRETPPLLSNAERWYQGGRWGDPKSRDLTSLHQS
jgi:hypothetical protein